MKILFTNDIINETLAATNESANYPVENIYHQFLKKRFQSTTTGSTITITLATAKIIDCLFIGYHNLNALQIKRYNASLVLIDTTTLTAFPETIVQYFTSATVKKIELIAASASTLYIGGIGSGECYAAPDFMADFRQDFIDQSIVTTSPFGQTLNNFIDPVKQIELIFPEMTSTIRDAILTEYKAIGIGAKIWVDFGNAIDPLYCFILNPVTYSRNGRRFYGTIIFQEAR